MKERLEDQCRIGFAVEFELAMPGWAALSTELKELEMGGDGERELGRWRSFGWWSFGSRQIAARWKLASCCPFARVAWQSSTSVTLKDGKMAALSGKAAGGVLTLPTVGGRPLQRPDVLPDSSPDLAVHVTNSGNPRPPQCMPGFETADCQPLYERRYPYIPAVPYLATHDAALPITNSRFTRSIAPRLHQPVGMAPLANCAIHACSFRLAGLVAPEK